MLEDLQVETEFFWENALKAMYVSGHFPLNLPVKLSRENINETDGHRVGNWIQTILPHLSDFGECSYYLIDSNELRYEIEFIKYLTKIYSSGKRVVLLFSFSSCYANLTKILLRKINKNFKDIIVVIGGIHVSSISDDEINSFNFSYAVKGEGDTAIKLILIELKEKNRIDVKKILKIKVETNDLKWNWSFYHKYSDKVNRYIPRISINRGCFYNCYFCSKISSQQSDLRIWDLVYKRIDEYSRLLGTKNIHFKICDPELSLDVIPKIGLIDFFKNRSYSWDCQVRVFKVDKTISRLLSQMKLSGCRSVFIGVESFQQHILNSCNKSIKEEDILPCLKAISNVGIAVLVPIIIGLPMQTSSDIAKDIEIISRLIKSKIINVCLPQPLTIYPGTSFFKNPGRHGITLIDYNYEGLEKRIMHRTETMSQKDIITNYKRALLTITGFHINYIKLFK